MLSERREEGKCVFGSLEGVGSPTHTLKKKQCHVVLCSPDQNSTGVYAVSNTMSPPNSPATILHQTSTVICYIWKQATDSSMRLEG
ncbi:hypothetical protein EYF80_037307 [Liparis tanakae]|uniref:Uncharacterized protein n=1 Tax=Liparis tanakae TaxID=230148 RepID=A0A4Z2GGQ9_9TELE|nr:hypothetical protein EYF80_037307 [Liparis tanakae]